MDELKLAEAIAQKMSKVPTHMTYWSQKEISDFLCCSLDSAKRITRLPDFPPRYTFPNGWGGKLLPRWLSSDVQEWAKSHRGKQS